MAFRDFAHFLAATALTACDAIGGRGFYGLDVISEETWEGSLDSAQPSASFRVEVEATAAERTTLRSSELIIMAGWDASDAAEVDIDLSIEDESVGSFELTGSSEQHSDAGKVELARVAPLMLDICVALSLRDAGAMHVVVNGVRYHYSIEEGSDIDPKVAIVNEPCE